MSVVDAIVVALVSEFELAYARDAQDYQYAITADTSGMRWNELQEGQRVRRLEVTPPPVRTISVRLLP